MGQPARRIPRTPTSTPLRVSGPHAPLGLSLPSIQALILLGCLAALGWHARHAASMPHVETRVASPRLATPRGGSRDAPARPAGQGGRQTAKQRSVPTARRTTPLLAAPSSRAATPNAAPITTEGSTARDS